MREEKKVSHGKGGIWGGGGVGPDICQAKFNGVGGETALKGEGERTGGKGKIEWLRFCDEGGDLRQSWNRGEGTAKRGLAPVEEKSKFAGCKTTNSQED